MKKETKSRLKKRTVANLSTSELEHVWAGECPCGISHHTAQGDSRYPNQCNVTTVTEVPKTPDPPLTNS